MLRSRTAGISTPGSAGWSEWSPSPIGAAMERGRGGSPFLAPRKQDLVCIASPQYTAHLSLMFGGAQWSQGARMRRAECPVSKRQSACLAKKKNFWPGLRERLVLATPLYRADCDHHSRCSPTQPASTRPRECVTAVRLARRTCVVCRERPSNKQRLNICQG